MLTKFAGNQDQAYCSGFKTLLPQEQTFKSGRSPNINLDFMYKPAPPAFVKEFLWIKL